MIMSMYILYHESGHAVQQRGGGLQQRQRQRQRRRARRQAGPGHTSGRRAGATRATGTARQAADTALQDQHVICRTTLP